MIRNLLGGDKLVNFATVVNGPIVVHGGTEKEGAVNEENLKSRHCLPIFNGKYNHEIFGMENNILTHP